MIDMYLSSSYTNRQEFYRRLETFLAQVRREQLGRHIKGATIDADRDALLRVDEVYLACANRIAQEQGLRLCRMGEQ